MDILLLIIKTDVDLTQTNLTTVSSDTGLPDGSQPVVTTIVDNGNIVVNNQSSGNILNTQ
jgi:hypothetical protein